MSAPAARRRPQRPSTPPDPARAAAVSALVRVLDKGQPLDVAFDAAAAGLDPRDRGFARNVATTTLRHLGRIDAVLNARLQRPIDTMAPEPAAILRAGAAQLLVLKTPPHAAVDAAVTLAAAGGKTAQKLKGLVNAVLRRAAEDEDRFTALPPEKNWPGWLMEAWTKAYGQDAARQIAAASAAEAPLDLTLPADRNTWAERLESEPFLRDTLRRTAGGAVPDLPGYEEGAWWVQDAAAALPARLLAVKPGERVADLCAAPGGKTLQLAAAGAEVTAIDSSAERLTRVAANLARTGLTAQLIAADVAQFTPDAPFDAVLLDAPCSATGTLRRRPDVAWTKRPKDVRALAQTQERLLAAAATLVKPGGRIVFCTCSLQAEEGPDVWEKARDLELVPDPVTPDEAPDLAPALDEAGSLRTHPALWRQAGGVDGFFVARARRLTSV